MDVVPVPLTALAAHPNHSLVEMGRPDGVDEADCGSASMLIGHQPAMAGFPGRDQLAFFKPTAEEIEELIAGGYVVMNQIGTVVQPFGLGVWPHDPPAPVDPPADAGPVPPEVPD